MCRGGPLAAGGSPLHRSRSVPCTVYEVPRAWGSTAVAAIKLPANSLGTAQLKNGAVTGQKVAKQTLTGANINLAKLGAVPNAANAARLGGKLPSAFGTITGVTAGTDLTGGGTSGQVSLDADETKLQHRVTGACAGSNAIASIDQAGGAACEPTGIQQMMGGTQLIQPVPCPGPTGCFLARVGATGILTSQPSDNTFTESAVKSTAGNLSVAVDPTPLGTGNTLIFTLQVNGTLTSLSCTSRIRLLRAVTRRTPHRSRRGRSSRWTCSRRAVCSL